MPKNKITDLRNHLFETIEQLKDGDMDIETAKAVNEVAKTLVHSAKVEVEAMREIGATDSEFLQIDAFAERKRLVSSLTQDEEKRFS